MLSKDLFKNPPCHCRPIPIWLWNSALCEDEIESRIRDFHEKGLGGFIIQAGSGLETEYLSREWMECVKRAAVVADELGMEVWISDDMGLPSGTGNMQVSRVKEYLPSYIELIEGHTNSEQAIELNIPAGNIVIAYAYHSGDPNSPKVDVSGFISNQRLSWWPQRGLWDVAVFVQCGVDDESYETRSVDYLNPEAMRYFFDCALEPYAMMVWEHFGKAIKGFFTHGHALLPVYSEKGHTGRLVVWSDRIANLVKSRVQLTPLEILQHLFFDMDETTPRIRREFWSTVEELYVKAFFQPYRQWCEDHGLKLMGYLAQGQRLERNTALQSNPAGALSLFNIPGIGYGTNGALEAKLVGSVASVNDTEAALGVICTDTGWGATIEQIKMASDKLLGLGINRISPCMMSYSISGFRRTDTAPSIIHTPDWTSFKQLADYQGRLSYMMQLGRHVAKVALLYPIEDFHGIYAAGTRNEETDLLSKSFELCTEILPRLHFDFDIISERDLSSASIINGKIDLKGHAYEVLIAPPSVLNGLAAGTLCEFVEQDGTWIIPPLLAGQLSWEGIEQMAVKLGAEGKVVAIETGTSDRDALARALDKALREAMKPDVKIASPSGKLLTDVRYIHQEADGKHVYLLTNTSDQPCKCIVSFQAMGALEEWDPETGTATPPANVERRDGRLSTERELPPHGSTVFVIDTSEEPPFKPVAKTSRVEMLVMPDQWMFKADQDNVLILDSMRLRMSTENSRHTYHYSAEFGCEFVPDKLLLMLDDVEYPGHSMGRMHIVVTVNDQELEQPECGWYLDKAIRTVDITSAVVKGENKIRIVMHHPSESEQRTMLVSPPVLLGMFSCDARTKTLMPPVEAAQSGSWTEFGHPFYSGTATYTHSFKLPWRTRSGRVIVSIDAVRDTAEVIVNGKSAGVRLWEPWEVDITDLLIGGRNMLSIKVMNSMANLLERTQRASGLMGPVRIYMER
ncbi:MAG: glycosylhydrolase-like jelly roll fold domain-containing protein [Armatimonadota bacterium]